jgi:two-component system, cell cycle sensor histidine kinase and response regulator CckA
MKAMNSDEFRKYVQDNLDNMTEIFARISMGDFSKRIDPSSLDPDDQFTQAFCGLDMMMDDIVDAHEELKSATKKLEHEVRQRTSDLSEANKKLKSDLVEQKRSEEWFAKREKFYTDIFNSIQDPISILDADLNIVSTNTTMEQWYKEILPIAGKKCYWVYHHKDKPCEKCPSLETIRTGNAAFEVVPKHNSFGKQTGWSALYSFPWKDTASGKVLGVIEYIKDISALRQAEHDLAQEKELLSVTMASIGDCVVSTDKDGRIVSINPAALVFAGIPLRETVGKHVDDVFAFYHEKVKDIHGGVVTFMIKNKGIKPMSVRCGLRLRGGAERIIDLSVAPINAFDSSVIGMVMVFRDMTERHKLELELYRVRKLDSLGVLAGGIAHDFNNILTGIITNLFMVKLRVKSDQDSFQLLEEAEKASFRASKLIKQLLTFSKGGAPVKESVAIKDIIEESIGFCLSGSNVNYKLELANDLSNVEADRGQIDQVFNNLIINADQAMPQGGTITVGACNVSIGDDAQQKNEKVVVLQPGAYIKVMVKDEGMGIPKESLEKIFDPYFTTKQNGNGLGLTIAYSIIKAHKGAITVDSEVGKGSVFSFYLPVAKPLKQSDGTVKTKPNDLPSSGGRILVMDDDSAVRSVLSQLLKNYGYDVVCAASGNETISAYDAAMKQGRPFTVVVMDLTIPGGMGGKEAVGKLLKIDPSAKVVVASGYSSDPIMANYREYGFCGVIAKPFNIDEFLAVVKMASAVEKE